MSCLDMEVNKNKQMDSNEPQRQLTSEAGSECVRGGGGCGGGGGGDGGEEGVFRRTPLTQNFILPYLTCTDNPL